MIFTAVGIHYPNAAFATGFVIPGTTRSNVANYPTWHSGDTVGFTAVTDRSYFCRSVASDGAQHVAFDTTVAQNGGSQSASANLLGAADGGRAAEEAFGIVAFATGTLFNVLTSATSGTGSSFGAIAMIQCFETSLYGNFNTITNANNVNYLEIKNISNVAVTVQVILYTPQGTAFSRLGRTLAANERQDIAIHEITAAQNTYGSIVLSHNGPLGGIVANLSKYRFDGVNMVITATEPLRRREQN